MIKISVNGTPAPQGSKIRGRHGGMFEASKALGPWREAVRAEAQRAAERPADGPVCVRLTFRLGRPRGHYGTGKRASELKPSAPAYPAGKPDLDKLARAVLDGLTQGGAWHDDKQVVWLACEKRYADVPGADIEIEEVQP